MKLAAKYFFFVENLVRVEHQICIPCGFLVFSNLYFFLLIFLKHVKNKILMLCT